jgi:ATP-dependent helicase HrpA
MDAQQLLKLAASRLDSITARDAAWCRKRMAAARALIRKGQPATELLQQISERIARSSKQVEQKAAGSPAPSYDPDLPISACRDALLETIRNKQVVIVAGETGSGKTTQIPKLCLEAGRGTRGLIGCTQPRRIAARAMADRVSEELGSPLGELVAYQVRFRERSSPGSYIKFMTDGILLSESMKDPYLDMYDTLIIDEAHERSLNIDFLLGYLKRLLPRRKDLRLIITSATIDTARFSEHFNDAPIVEGSGRTYPVEQLYQPLGEREEKSERSGKDLYQGIADAVRKLTRKDPQGDILVFLSGEREIREAGDFLSRQMPGRAARGTEILPLYARLSAAEQRRVFHPGPQRRIILATNVAETSLTVPRIRFVIDSGLARISRYAHRSRIQRLPIEPISQASANQRAGRCGRLGPGTCVRLYSEEDFDERPEFTEPEILRTSLASVILRMLTMRLGTVEEFPFVDRPAPRMINDAYQLLTELGAIDSSRVITPLGKRLANWPMDVRLARMVEEGARRHCLEDMMVLAAALSIQDPRERPLDAQDAADEAHARFSDTKSDFVTLLQLWQYLRSLRKSISGNQFRKRCRREFLNWQRVLEWFDLYQQLRDKAREDRMRLSGGHGDYEQVHKSLLAGLLSHCGQKNPEDPGYTGVRSKSFHIFPGSGLFGSAPKWLMAAEIVETSRPYARINAVIKPEWLEEQAAGLLKHRCFDPHWSSRRAAVMAWEQVSLYGLVIVEKRRVQYDSVDPLESRKIFILEALVRGQFDTRASFKAHNEAIRAEVEALEHKRRRRDVLADEAAQFEFFDARIPGDVNSGRSFEKWLGGLGEKGRNLLYLGHDVLMREDAGLAPLELFPDEWRAGGRSFPLEYHFAPGHPRDGVTLTVPLESLNLLRPGRLEWLVPGLLRDKLVALIKQLPKPLRRSLTPAPAFADALMEAMQEKESESMLQACAEQIVRLTGLQLSRRDFDEDAIEDHFKFFIRVVDPRGEVLESGRDLQRIQEKLGKKAQRSFMDRQGAAFNKDGLVEWSFGKLPAEVETADGARAWPALVDQGSSAGLRLFDTRGEAVQSHIEGVLRLVALHMPDKLRYLCSHHGLSSDAQLAWTALGSVAELVDDLARRSLADTCGEVSAVRNPEQFEALCARVRNAVGRTQLTLVDKLNECLPLYSKLVKRIQGGPGSKWPATCEDIESQLADLIYPGFLSELGEGRLDHLPRYLQSIEERLFQLEQNPARDAQRMAQIEPWWQHYLEALEQGLEYNEPLDTFRWLVHEYRVSLFAQRLGTAEKVSAKRLADAWSQCGC